MEGADEEEEKGRRWKKRGECLAKFKARSEKWQKQTDQILKAIMTKNLSDDEPEKKKKKSGGA